MTRNISSPSASGIVYSNSLRIGPILRLFRVRLDKSANKPSTALSQEAEVGVKWKTKRGWHASHSRTLGCLVEADSDYRHFRPHPHRPPSAPQAAGRGFEHPVAAGPALRTRAIGQRVTGFRAGSSHAAKAWQ